MTTTGSNGTGANGAADADPVTVRVPTILRSYTGGAAEVTVRGGTVKDVLDALDAAYPGIRARVVDDEGSVRRFVNVYVGDEDVRFADGVGTAAPAGSVVSVIPAVAGGATWGAWGSDRAFLADPVADPLRRVMSTAVDAFGFAR